MLPIRKTSRLLSIAVFVLIVSHLAILSHDWLVGSAISAVIDAETYPGTGKMSIGDTLTVIQRPLLNIPAIAAAGDTIEMACDASPSTTGWAAELRRGSTVIPLTVLGASYDPSVTWWTVSVRIPVSVLSELYDLRVTASGGIDDITWNAVKVIPGFRNDYYFIHLTDTHLPTHYYYYEPEADTDSSEVIDFREVIADINLINPEFVLITGDFINEGELEEFLNRRYYTRCQRLLTEFEVPVYLTAGNHDIGGWNDSPPSDGTARRDWWRFFGWKILDDPPAGAPWYTQNYSFDYGPVHYVALESYINYDSWKQGTYGDESFTSGQLSWLDDDLADASGSSAQVLFYHRDFADQIDLNSLNVEMALSGHIHRDAGNIHSQPYDLSTDNVCDGARSYRLVRVAGTNLDPTSTVSSGSSGQNLRVQYSPVNDGTHYEVTAQITNNIDEQFEYGQIRFLMPDHPGDVTVTGGTLTQTDDSQSPVVHYVAVDIAANSSPTVTISIDTTGATAISDVNRGRLDVSAVKSFPNPFNPNTTLSFTLPKPGETELVVFDIHGRQVTRLVSEWRDVGDHNVAWDGRDESGRLLPSGIYFARLKTSRGVEFGKAVLMR